MIAIPDEGFAFAYWEDARSGTMISTNPVYTFIMGSGENVKAVFYKLLTPETEVFNVVFKNKSGKILQSESVEKNVYASAPADPMLVGYRFIGWDKDFSSVSTDMIINPIFERLPDAYTITVEGGKLSTGGTIGEFQFDMPVKVIADSAPSGKKFSHWEHDGVKISTDASFTFFAPQKATTITAIFVTDDSVINETPFIVLYEDVLADAANHFMMFTAKRTMVSGYTLVESGVLLLNSNTPITDELTLYTENVVRGKIRNDSTDQFYIRKSNVADGDTWYARAYLIYMDSYNNIYIVYSSNTVSKRMEG